MPAMRYPTNLDTLQQKLNFQRILGSVNACKYFDLIRGFLGYKVDKCDFDRLCIAIIGTENIHLHNHFLKSILKAACLPNTAFPIPRQRTVERSLNANTPNGCSNLQIPYKDRLHSIRKCKTPNLRCHRVKVGSSPPGLPRKSSRIGIENSAPKIQEQQSNIPLGLPVKSSSIGNSASKIQEQQSNIPLGLPEKRSNSIGIEDSAPKIHKQQSNIPLGLPEKKSNSIGIEDSAPKIHKQQSNIPLGLPGKRSNSIGIEDSAPKFHEQQSNIPLGLPGKSSSNGIVNLPPKVHKQLSNIDLHNVFRTLTSSEIQAITGSPLLTPLAIPTYNSRAQKVLHKRLQSGTNTDTCESTGQLPDTQSLTKRLKKNLETEGLEISADAANLMNNALDVYLKRLIKPCLDLAASKSVKKSSHPFRLGLGQLPRSRSTSSSISDFRTAIEINPTILGENWPQRFEEICFRASEQ